jgi:hypothetical protein
LNTTGISLLLQTQIPVSEPLQGEFVHMLRAEVEVGVAFPARVKADIGVGTLDWSMVYEDNAVIYKDWF